MRASERWREQLAAWAIPEEILAQAPEDPWALPPALFAQGARFTPDTPGMLAAFTAKALEANVVARTVQGRWPDVAASVAPHDVVVCHHVVYNVADIEPFMRALHDHARRRVVVELTAEHPRSQTNPLWKRFWNLDRPAGPVADDLVAVVGELGIDARAERFESPSLWDGIEHAHLVEFTRRQLCLPASRDAEISEALAEHPPPRARRLVTIWWDV